ncbi:MAG: hypothetical protein HC777_02800 [Hyphomonadaceae bacterium]|nr:hypothetical protein [Hyphomonadaceae bacterium]
MEALFDTSKVVPFKRPPEVQATSQTLTTGFYAWKTDVFLNVWLEIHNHTTLGNLTLSQTSQNEA